MDADAWQTITSHPGDLLELAAEDGLLLIRQRLDDDAALIVLTPAEAGLLAAALADLAGGVVLPDAVVAT